MAKKQSSDRLEHTRGGAITRDPMDAGVPMTPGRPDEPVGPEDALGAGPKRGDYSDRIVAGPAMRVERIPEEEREVLARGDNGEPLELGPATRLVPAGDDVGNIGDAPGKGGVSTDEARAGVPVGGAPGQPAAARATGGDGGAGA